MGDAGQGNSLADKEIAREKALVTVVTVNAAPGLLLHQLLRMHWLMAYDFRSRNFDGSNSVKTHFRLCDYEDRHKHLLAELQKYTTTLEQASLAHCGVIHPTRNDSFAVFKDMPSLRNEIRHVSEKPERINVEEAMRQPRSELLAYSPNHVFVERFKLNEEENNGYSWTGLKYLLFEYEEYLAKGKAIQLPWRVIAKRPMEQTIERILPQTPDDPYWKSRFNKDSLRCFLHDLGNLCLASDNSA
jgi:hypothetical protein